MAEKERRLKLPFRKSYAWKAQMTVDMPIQLGREQRVFHPKGEMTFEFLPMDDPDRAALKLIDFSLTLPETDLVLSTPDEYWMEPIHIPELTIGSDAIDLKGSVGFVELATGRFSLQFTIHLTPEVVPLLAKYQIKEVPVLVQEAGKLDLGEGDKYFSWVSWVRFTVAPEYTGEFQFYCGGSQAPEPKCPTKTSIFATLGDPKEGHHTTVYTCPGERVGLWWSSSADVTQATISPDVGSVDPNDHIDVYPTSTTDYKITVKGECEREAQVRVHVIQEGEEIEIAAAPVSNATYWEYKMPVTCVSQNIKVTSIQPICGLNCFYQPVFELIFLNCGDYMCHGQWASLKEDPDGHLHSFTPSLVRINLPEIPWAGTWQFWAIGQIVRKAEGNAYFVITVKCG